jgi:hypothetical protein
VLALLATRIDRDDEAEFDLISSSEQWTWMTFSGAGKPEPSA